MSQTPPAIAAQAESAATGLAAPELMDWRIEAFRALAAAMVMTVHYLGYFGAENTPLLYLFTGVDLFFVLSGYVFAPYLLAGKRLHTESFLIRRFFRLYPLYLLSLVAYTAFKWGDPQLGAMLLRHLFMAHSLESREIAYYFNGAYWSLPPEVEFYLLLPALAWLCARRWGFAMLVVLAVAARVTVTVLMPASYTEATIANVAAFHLPGLLVEFILGAGAWWCANRMRGNARAWGVLLFAAGVAISLLWAQAVVARLLAGGNHTVHTDPLTRGNVQMIAALGYALIVAGVLRAVPMQPAPRFVQRAALWAGGCSYAVYLMHTLAPHLVGKLAPGTQGPALGLAAAALTFALATLMHWSFEDPMRRWGRDIARSRARSA